MKFGSHSKDALVQPTTARLPGEMGWQSAYAFNDEDFVPGSLLGRGSDREVVLTRTLREKLIQFNRSLPPLMRTPCAP
ncbi:MAG TPA: hypothetical protein PKG66_09165 [Methanothrix sp.]|nr:hypothetical protein [Methanothrix sp.]